MSRRMLAVLLVLGCGTAGSSLLLAAPAESQNVHAVAAVATATATTVVVVKITPTVTLTSASESPLRFGDSSSFTATVSPASATGTVSFTYIPVSGPEAGNTVPMGSPSIGGDATASLSVPILAFGANEVTATYRGDAAFTEATSDVVTEEVIGYAGQVLVTEFRGSGPRGPDDSYVELYNPGPLAVPLPGFQIRSGTDTATLDYRAGILETRRSYLVTGDWYSLFELSVPNFHPLTLGTGGFEVLAPDSAGTRTDAVGSADGLHLGTGLPEMTIGATDDQWAWVRDQAAGEPLDTRDNAADFRLVSDTGRIFGDARSTLGGASPTSAFEPYPHNDVLRSTLLAPGAGQALDPNRTYTPGNPGKLIIRRTITNSSAMTMTAAKMRVTALSEAYGAPRPGTGPQPGSLANLRVVQPATLIPVAGDEPVVNYLSLEIPTVHAEDSGGGGLNSTLQIPLGDGLDPGETVNVAVTFAVDTPGAFWFGYDIEAKEAATARLGGALQRPAFAPGSTVNGVL